LKIYIFQEIIVKNNVFEHTFIILYRESLLKGNGIWHCSLFGFDKFQLETSDAQQLIKTRHTAWCVFLSGFLRKDTAHALQGVFLLNVCAQTRGPGSISEFDKNEP
jgi:hypothetical protein